MNNDVDLFIQSVFLKENRRLKFEICERKTRIFEFSPELLACFSKAEEKPLALAKLISAQMNLKPRYTRLDGDIGR